MFDAPPNQPLSVGDLVGRAFRIYRVNIPQFLHVLLWPTVFGAACRVVFQFGLTFLSKSGLKDINGAILGGVIMLVGLVSTYAVVWLLVLRQLAFVRIINGFDPTFEEAYKFVRKRGWTIVGLMFLGYALAGGICFVWIIELLISFLMFKAGSILTSVSILGMALGVLGLLLSAVLFCLVGFLVCPLVACENQALGTLISRSFNLTVNDFGRSILFGLLLLLTITSLSYPLNLPLVALTVFDMFRNGVEVAQTFTDLANIPFHIMLITQVWESLVNMLLWPISFLAYGMFYYDLRIRQEGLDIVQNLELIEKNSAA